MSFLIGLYFRVHHDLLCGTVAQGIDLVMGDLKNTLEPKQMASWHQPERVEDIRLNVGVSMGLGTYCPYVYSMSIVSSFLYLVL